MSVPNERVPSTFKPTGFDELLAGWMDALRLADDFSQDHFYTAFYGALMILHHRTEQLIAMRPNIEVGEALRMPITPERVERIMSDCGVPDVVPDDLLEDPLDAAILNIPSCSGTSCPRTRNDRARSACPAERRSPARLPVLTGCAIAVSYVGAPSEHPCPSRYRLGPSSDQTSSFGNDNESKACRAPISRGKSISPPGQSWNTALPRRCASSTLRGPSGGRAPLHGA